MKWFHKQFWLSASPNETIQIFERITQSKTFKGWNAFLEKNDALADFVFEYVWLYRSEESVRKLLNHGDFPSWLLLRFVYFGFGKHFQLGKFDSGEYYTELKLLLGPESSLRILSLATEMERDPTLKIHLLSNLDPQTWEAYFDMIDGENITLQALIGIFTSLKASEIRKILFNSPTLYMYLRMMMISRSSLSDPNSMDEKAKKLKETLAEILESIYVWEKFNLDIKAEYDLKLEKSRPPRDRNLTRVTKILHSVKSLISEERDDVLSYLKGSAVILDHWEESLIYSSLVNYAKFGKFV